MQPKANWTKCRCGCWNKSVPGFYTATVGPFTLIACRDRWGVRDHDVQGSHDRDVVENMIQAEKWARDTAAAMLEQLA